ncbi:MAG: hypothetical protein ACRCU2_16545 [Planktothrix sp.]
MNEAQSVAPHPLPSLCLVQVSYAVIEACAQGRSLDALQDHQSWIHYQIHLGSLWQGDRLHPKSGCLQSIFS